MSTPRSWDVGAWQQRRDIHHLACAAPKVNRWGVPLRQWRSMLARDRQEIIDYQLHPRREGRDELADHRREGGGEWRPAVRERL